MRLEEVLAQITGDMKRIYQVSTVEAAELTVEDFAANWEERYPAMIAAWRRAGPDFVPFRDFHSKSASWLHHQRHRIAQRPLQCRRPQTRPLPR